MSIAAAAPGLRLMGFSSLETAGATAGFFLHNGTSGSDPVLFACTVGQNESRAEWFGEGGILSQSGIWLERLTGTTRVIVYYKAVG